MTTDSHEPVAKLQHPREGLHAERELLQVALASVGDAVITLDPGGSVLFLNPVAEALTGWTREEALSKPLDAVFNVVSEEGRQKVESPTLRALRNGPVVGGRERALLIAKDGTERLIEDHAAPVRDETGAIAGGVLVFRDVSGRVALERQTKEQAHALAELHRRKDEFLAMLSHELRNPLAPISNAVVLLRLQKSENAIQQQARIIIERQVAQLVRTVDDLLEVSRITTGRFKIRQERVAVSSIVERAVDAVRALVTQRRQTIEVTVPRDPIWLFADAARLEQVLVNLLTNAAKYTEPGGRIWMTVQQERQEAILSVRDTGVGIAPDVLPRIFDLFTQAERSLDRSQGGLGIGLCLVQRLVSLHQGTVRASSVLGQGSEFIVRLPVMAATAVESPPAAAAPDVHVAPTGSRLRVLVVDDNDDTAESMAILMQAAGHRVRTASTGPAALQVAADQRPDVIVLDIGLPGLDGYEVARRIRQQASLRDTVLVAMTGYGQEADYQRSKEAGFDHHLVKPADFHRVQEILAAVVPARMAQQAE